MLSISQKQAIYQAVLKTYTIATKSFTPSVIYSNQPITSYPVILLNYPKKDIKKQNAAGNYIGTSGSKGQRSEAWLSINVMAEDAQGLNKVTISEEIAGQLANDIRANWTSLSSGTIRFNRKSDTNDLTHIEQAAGTLDVARQQFDVFLSYDIIW